MYWDIKELSRYLHIKSSTLYAWAAQGRIPSIKLHGLVRFQREQIDAWVDCFRRARPELTAPFGPRRNDLGDVDHLIARAKREVYNSHCGEATPISSPREEGDDGVI